MKNYLIHQGYYLFITLFCISGLALAEEVTEASGDMTLSESSWSGDEGTPTSEASTSSSGEEGVQNDQTATEGDPPAGGADETEDDLYEPKQEQSKESVASAKTVTIANTGAATYSYPLNLPPARGQAAPQLSIRYNSQSRSSRGVLGFGFGLGIPSIQRSTKRGLDYSAFDFVANGGQELVSRKFTWGSRFYGAKFESTFTRYYVQSADPVTGQPKTWVATTREGIKYFYGTTEASRQEFSSQKIFKWYVDRIEDTNGNYVTYEYSKDKNTVYLEAIEYSKHENKPPMYRVELMYPEDGDLSTVSYETHYPTMKRKRLGAIEIRVGENHHLVREYKFHYQGWCDPDICDGGELNLSDEDFGLWFLNAIVQIEYDYDGTPSTEKNFHSTTKFNWQDASIAHFNNISEYDYPAPFDQTVPSQLPFDPDIDQKTVVFDYDGDNRDDILYYQFNAMIKGTYGDSQTWEKPGERYVRIFRSTGNGYTEIDQDVVDIFGINFPKMTQITAFDYNGDNRDDLLFWNPISNHVWLYRSQKDGNAPTDLIYEYVDQWTAEDSKALFGDFRTTLAALTLEPPPGPTFPARVNRVVSASSVLPADFNGDGKEDLFIFNVERKLIALNEGPGYGYKLDVHALQSTGDSNVFKTITVDEDLLPDFDEYDEIHTLDARAEMLAVDLNADGYSDIVTLIGEALRVSFSSVDDSGNVTFPEVTVHGGQVGPHPPIQPDPNRPIDPAPGRRLHPMDYNGDGYTDLLVAAPLWERKLHFETQSRKYNIFRYDAANDEFVKLFESDDGEGKPEVFFKMTPFNFNDDGKTDLLVDCGRIRVSNGDGTFRTVKQNLNQEVWGWDCGGIGPWGGDFNYTRSSFIPLDMDGNGVHEIYFEGNYQQYPEFYSPGMSNDKITQRYYRSMILGGLQRKTPYLVDEVTTTYGCDAEKCGEDYHHRVKLAYELSSGKHNNHYMPQVSSLVTKTTESVGTNVDTPESTTQYEYGWGYYHPKEREFAGFEFLWTYHPDGTTYEIAKYYVGEEHEFKRGRLIWHGVYESEIIDRSTDRLITEYTWNGTPIEGGDEAIFVSLGGGDKWAKQFTIKDSSGDVVTQDYYLYDLRNGMAIRDFSVLVESNLPDEIQVENVTKRYEYKNYGEWVWRRAAEYVIGEKGGVTMFTIPHVHRAIHYDYQENTGNVEKEEMLGSGGHQLVTYWDYDEFGNVWHEQDPQGNITTYLYDDKLAMFYKEIRKPATTNVVTLAKTDHVLSFPEYNYKHGKPLSFVDENGNGTTYTYDYLGRTVSIVRPHYPSGVKEETVYTDDDFPRYSESTMPTDIGQPSQEVRTYIDGADRVVQTTTRGETTDQGVQYIRMLVHYDTMGRKVKDEGPSFCDTKEYPSITCKSDVWHEQSYDYLSRVTRIDTSGDIESTTEYHGLMIRNQDPDYKVKWITKDHRENILKIEQYYMAGWASQETYYVYNAAGDLLAIRRRDPLHQISLQNSFVYDLYGRTVQTSDPDMGTWTYEYDDNGNLIKQIDANGNILEFAYDELNRKTQEFSFIPKRGSAAYAPAWGFDYFYEEGDTVSYRDKVYVATQAHWSSSSNRPPLNQCIWAVLTNWTIGEYYCAGTRVGHKGLVYQAMMGHYASEDWEPGVDQAMWELETVFETRNISTFTYDDGYIDEYTVPNGIGQLYSAQNSETKITYKEYDEAGRLLKLTKQISGAPDEDGYTTSTQYDWAGKIKNIEYPDGLKIHYNYHPGTALIQSVGDSELLSEPKFAVLDDYQADGKIGRATYGWKSENSYATRTTYNYYHGTKRLKRIHTTNLNGDSLQDKTYTYSKARDVLSVEDARAGVRYVYEYDDFHRLIAEKHQGIKYTGGEFTTLVNSYEKAHPHAVKKTERGGMPGVKNSHYEYDNNGNLIRVYKELPGPGGLTLFDSRRIMYNAKNMPVLIDNYEAGEQSVTEFGYDPDYQRLRKSVADSTGIFTTIYVSAGFEVKAENLGEPDEAVEKTKYIFAGNVRVAKATDEGLFYIHKDHLGSTSVVTNESGETPPDEPAFTEYLPYGLPRPDSELSSKTDYAFTDQEIDRSTGFYNYDARLYNPEIGMFITADFLLPDVFDTQLLNRYTYTRNNPIIYVDPTGHVQSAADSIRDYSTYAGYAIVYGNHPSSIGIEEDAVEEKAQPAGTNANDIRGGQRIKIAPSGHKLGKKWKKTGISIVGSDKSNREQTAGMLGGALGSDAKGIMFRRNRNKLDVYYNTKHKSKNFRWQRLTDIAGSGKSINIQLGNTFAMKIRGMSASKAMTDPGYTLVPKSMAMTGDTSYSVNDSINIYLSNIRIEGLWATNQTMAHELFGHAYLATQGQPYLHSSPLSGAPMIGGGTYKGGTVKDWMQKNKLW